MQFLVNVLVAAGHMLGFYWDNYGVISYDVDTDGSSNYCGANVKLTERPFHLNKFDRIYALSYYFCELSELDF